MEEFDALITINRIEDEYVSNSVQNDIYTNGNRNV